MDSTKKNDNSQLRYCRIHQAILYDPALTPAEKIILGLAGSLTKGLGISNDHLGKILGLHPGRVSVIVSKLLAAGQIMIKGKSSRYRRIYLSAGMQVVVNSTLTPAQSTFAQAQSYICAGVKHNNNKVNIKPCGLRQPGTAAAGLIKKPLQRQQQKESELLKAGTVDPQLSVKERTGMNFKSLIRKQGNGTY